MGECWRGQVDDGPQNARLSRPRGLDARLTDARRVCAISHSFRVSVKEATLHFQIWPSVNSNNERRDVFESAWEDLPPDSAKDDDKDPISVIRSQPDFKKCLSFFLTAVT